MFKRIFKIILLIIAILLAILLWNYLGVTSRQIQVAQADFPAMQTSMLTRLSAAIRIPTVTGQFDPQVFLSFLQAQFPRVFATLNSTVINQGGLVLHWPGRSATQKPILFLAHYDVVPATAQDWTHPPFSGAVAEDYVWGRGSMDDKLSVLAQLEAIELLLAQGFQPQRDIYLAFGHDEETGGTQGANVIAAHFFERNLKFEFVLDEGLLITDGILSFVDKPVALIGIAEKGYADIELELQGEGGHASMPGQTTLLGELSNAISRLQAEPMPARLTGQTQAMLDTLAPESAPLQRLVFTNLWLFRPVVMRQFTQQAATHAAVHTTLAPTQMSASDKANVLPSRVTANINVRMLPGVTSERVVTHLRRVIDNADIAVRVSDAAEPVGVAAVDSWGYRQIATAIRQVYADVLVAPGLVLAATDSRHYAPVAQQIYRFVPIKVTQQDLARFHGRDERIATQAYYDAIRFYYQCMKNSAGAAEM